MKITQECHCEVIEMMYYGRVVYMETTQGILLWPFSSPPLGAGETKNSNLLFVSSFTTFFCVTQP